MTDANDDLPPLNLPKRKSLPWGPILVVLVSVGAALLLYMSIDQKGPSLRGSGHVVVLPEAQGGTWALMIDGAAVKLSPASVARLNPRSGPCESISGSLEGEELDAEELLCTPGPVQKAIGDRLRRANLKFAYWDASLPFDGETLEPYLQTPEVIGAMLDTRTENPQLIPLYWPLYPHSLAVLRLSGKLPPPLMLAVKRDDLQLRRIGRLEATQFFSRPLFHLAGGASQGGWLVRTLEMVDDGAPPAAKLLLEPTASPWPELLREKRLKVARPKLMPPPNGDAPATPAPLPQ